MYNIPNKYLWFALVALALTYVFGLFIDVQDVDASQYASISMEMMQNGDFLQVKHLGKDYLDKPPLLFWLSAISFKIFGLSNFAYKLPSFLFSLFGFYATYRFAKLYYNENIARLSALMLASSVAMVLINNDVRTDTLLLSMVILATWQLAEYLKFNKWKNLIWGSIFVGGAMLTKGPIGLIVPMLAFGSDWLLKRQWHNIFRWQWLVAIALIGLVLAPMLYGLTQQYGSYGSKFYFYYQSFGRVTGDNPFINSGMGEKPFSPFFFTHTFLWSFIPWSLFTVGTLVLLLVKLAKQQFKLAETDEAITFGGFVLSIIALSFAAYKLPHYIFVVLPYAAIMAAMFADKLVTNYSLSNWRKLFIGLHGLMAALLVTAVLLLAAWVFPISNILVWLLFGISCLVFITSYFAKTSSAKLILPVLMGFIAANLLLNAGIFPKLLEYQSVNQAGKYFRKHGEGKTMVTYLARGKAIDFYAGKPLAYTSNFYELDSLTTSGDYVYTDETGIERLHHYKMDFDTIASYRHYNVSLISIPFLNPTTRESKLKNRYLVQVK